MSLPRWRPVLTLPGLAALLIALALLVRALAARNPYEIALSAAVLVLLLALGAAGAWAARKFAAAEPLCRPPLPLSAGAGEEWAVTGLALPIPWFFRLHYLIRGRFYPQGGAEGFPVFAGTSAGRGQGAAAFVLDFPLGGVLRAEGFCRLRDLFGFFSFPCGLTRQETLRVRSAPGPRKDTPLAALSGAEDRRNRSSSDEERYYMREYAPGDRLRDINWKSSERIDTLITRISPDNQEKISRLELCFRNFGPVSRPQAGDLWLLDRAKARLARFLRMVKDAEASDARASYVFLIHTAQGDREVKDQAELEEFLEELAALPFAAPRNEGPAAPGNTGELYVFSTACDTALPAFLLSRQGRPVSLFLVQGGGGTGDGGTEFLRLRDFPAGGFAPPPRWIFPAPARRLAAGAGRVELEYAEVRW